MRLVALLSLALTMALSLHAADIKVQAHRGGLLEVPENTMAAFDHAWALGTIPEVDVRTTSDGVLICLHDATLARTAPTSINGDTPVEQLSLAEVQAEDVGAWFDASHAGQRVPELRAVFDRLREDGAREVYLDLKAADMERLAALIQEYGVASQIIFVHNKAESGQVLKLLVPELRVGQWIGGDANVIYNRFQLLVEDDFVGMDWVQLHLNKGKKGEDDWPYALSQAQLRQAITQTAAAGVELEVLPFEFDCAGVKTLVDMGVRRFATDEPARFTACLQELEQRHFLNNGVTAHRGDSTAHPENTLSAIQSALALGVDWIEVDVHRSSDGGLMVIHDETTGRVAGEDLKVADSTVSELRALDVSTGFRAARGLDEAACPPEAMPTLRQVLMLIVRQDKTRLSIQPKADVVEAVVALVKEVKAEPWVGFNDGDLAKMKQVKALAPELPVFWDRPAAFNLTEDIATATANGFEAMVVHADGVTPDVVTAIAAAGLEPGAWTVNDPETMQKLLAMGVKRLYTDAPALQLKLKGGANS